jgi:hypothetical protein
MFLTALPVTGQDADGDSSWGEVIFLRDDDSPFANREFTIAGGGPNLPRSVITDEAGRVRVPRVTEHCRVAVYGANIWRELVDLRPDHNRVVVRLLESRNTMTEVLAGPALPSTVREVHVTIRAPAGRARVRTLSRSGDGAFRGLIDLPLAPVSIEARAGPFWQGRGAHRPGEDVVRLTLVRLPSRTVRIRVIDGAGQAVSGCPLWVMLGANEELRRVATGAGGDVQLEVPRGPRPGFEVRLPKRPRVWEIHPLPLKARGDAEFTITLLR